MKTALLLLVALPLLAVPTFSHALTLQPGQSIGVDFGASSRENQFNPCDPNTPGILVNGSLVSIIDTTGAAVTGIGIQFAGQEVVASNDGTTQDFANYSGFSLANIQTGLTGNNFSMTITGLDPNQRFTLDLISSYSGRNIGTEFIVNGIHILTNSTSTTGGTLAHFTDLLPDANGTLTILTLGHDTIGDSRWVGVNAALLTAQAVPEPSALALGAIGSAGWAFAVSRTNRWRKGV